MPNITSQVYTDDNDRVKLSITYNDSKEAGFDIAGEPYYTIKSVSAVNTGSNTYLFEAYQAGDLKYQYTLNPSTNESSNIPGSSQFNTDSSTISVIKQ